MLEALITARVSTFLDFDERLSDTMLSSRSNSFKSRSNSLDSELRRALPHCLPPPHTLRCACFCCCC